MLSLFCCLLSPQLQADGIPGIVGVAIVLVPVVYIVLQLTKQAVPQVSGIWALLLNFALNALGYVIALPQDQWFTMATLLALAASVGGAAGLHGTVKSLVADKL